MFKAYIICSVATSSLVIAYLVITRRNKLVSQYPILRFQSWQDANKADSCTNKAIVVDCTHDTIPCITHHRMNRDKNLNGILIGDSSTELVLNALKKHQSAFKSFETVTVNHFDIDAFFSIWSLLNPHDAVKYRNEICEGAHIGDFRELGKFYAC